MNLWVQIIGVLVACLAVGWVFRFAGEKVTDGKPFFRDMPLSVAFGYVLGVVVLIWIVWSYYLARTLSAPEVNKYFFFRIAIEGFIIFAIAAWLFRLLGRSVGTEGTKKLFRQMPLTASLRAADDPDLRTARDLCRGARALRAGTDRSGCRSQHRARG